MTSLLALLTSVGLIAAGCGGSDDKNGGSNGSGGTPSGDVKSILGGIKAADTDASSKAGLSLTVDLKGTPKDQQLALVLDGSPITLDLSGPVGKGGKNADLDFGVKAGKINLKGGLKIIDGNTGFVELADKWYALPAGALNTTDQASSALETQKILDAIGDPNKLLKNATVVGAEDIEGVATDHVSGDIDTTALVETLARVSGSVDTGDTPISPDQIKDAVSQVEKFVKGAKLDLWVGQDSKQIHRLKLDIKADLDEATKESSGLEGLDATLTVTTTPTDEPKVEAPSGALPAEQLSQDIGGILLSSFGGTP